MTVLVLRWAAGVGDRFAHYSEVTMGRNAQRRKKQKEDRQKDELAAIILTRMRQMKLRADQLRKQRAEAEAEKEADRGSV